MQPIGRKRWAIAEGYLPGWSHGPGPGRVGQETACILSAPDREARLGITIVHPEPIPGATPFAGLLESEGPVVVQHARLDSRQAENALLTTPAFTTDQ